MPSVDDTLTDSGVDASSVVGVEDIGTAVLDGTGVSVAGETVAPGL